MSTTASASPSSPAPATLRVERRRPLYARVGLIGVGHHVYWEQFDGLLDEMGRKQRHVRSLLESEGVDVRDFGLIDNAQTAYDAVPQILAADIDVLFVDMVTYATSSTFGVLCREVRVPIVLVAIQPMKAMDYPNGTTYMQLCNDDFCSVPEFTGVAVRFGRRVPPVILGHEDDDPEVARDIRRWCGIAKVLHSLRKSRIGLMGHVLESMLDMHTDPTAITSAFGLHVVLVEPGEIFRHYRTPDTTRVDEWKARILAFFDTPDP